MTAEAVPYGKKTQVQIKTFCAKWYRASGASLLRVVVVVTERGQVPIRGFFCTRPHLDEVRILEGYAGRWETEVFLRDAQQLLGFVGSSAGRERAVPCVAPPAGVALHGARRLVSRAPRPRLHTFAALRPWYKHKRGLSFADILREARRAISTADIRDLANDSHSFKNAAPPRPPADLPAINSLRKGRNTSQTGSK